MRFNKTNLEQFAAGSHRPRLRSLVRPPLRAYEQIRIGGESDRKTEAFAEILREMQRTGQFNLASWYNKGNE